MEFNVLIWRGNFSKKYVLKIAQMIMKYVSSLYKNLHDSVLIP